MGQIVTAFVIFTVLCPFVLTAKLTDCNCNYGAIEEEAPQCLCACFAGYLQPECRFTATETVIVEYWLDLPKEQFISQKFVEIVRWAVSDNDGTVKYLYGDSKLNKTNPYLEMTGAQAQLALYDVKARQQYVVDWKIESAYQVFKAVAPPQPFTKKYIIYASEDGSMEVTVNTVGWLVGAILVAVVACCIEDSCSSNNEIDIIDAMDRGEFRDVSFAPKRTATDDEMNRAAIRIQCAQRKKMAKKEFAERKELALSQQEQPARRRV